jgi:uroporphyrin-III C-methyltransferase/precorrin-2 dehydrogenase/sirohydrochlorin ferrochelatase
MYFPVSLKVGGERCLVVGGGGVALRKAKALARAGARLTIVSPDVLPGFRGLRAASLRRRAFRAGDVAGHVLAIAATDAPDVNRAVFDACRRRGIPVNVVDVPELCSFIVPSVARRGPVTVAVSTEGLSPSLAKALRERMEDLLPASVGALARRLGARRRRILRELPPSAERTRRLKALVRKEELP